MEYILILAQFFMMIVHLVLALKNEKQKHYHTANAGIWCICIALTVGTYCL